VSVPLVDVKEKWQEHREAGIKPEKDTVTGIKRIMELTQITDF